MDFDLQRAMGKSEAPGEDLAYYEIYPVDFETSADQLEALANRCMELVSQHTHGYIWQRDSFMLCSTRTQPRPWVPASPAKAEGPACLWGRTAYGDNVEDEWFITWLLLQLTRQLKITARIWDSDGEFLLIEAAYTLPAWLKPETAAERVWLKEGALHIIPQSHPGILKQPTTQQALQVLRQAGEETLAPSQMQAAISARLAGYPQTAAKNTHHAAVTLPTALAAVLQQEPQLISGAVEAFYYRDPGDVKAARKLRHFPPDKGMVDTVVSFSRCLYAQMAGQGYETPRRYPLPLPSEAGFAAAQLGMKLVAGFEMLLAQASPEPASGPQGTKDVEGVPGWQAHLQGLADQGFFQGHLTGSQAHTHLMQQAAASFRATEAYAAHRAAAHEPAARILELAQRPFDPSKVTATGESDAWLAEAAEEIEGELQRRKEEVPQDKAGEPPEDLAKRFNAFLGGEAGLDGIDGEAGVFDEDPPGDLGSMGDDVELSEQEIWKEMKRMLHFGERGGDGETSEEGSSFYGDDFLNGGESSGGESGGMYAEYAGSKGDVDPMEAAYREAKAKAQGGTSSKGPAESRGHSRPGEGTGRGESNGWDAATATDSDDEATGSSSGEDVGPGYFDKAYDEAMRSELSSYKAMKVADPFGEPSNAGEDMEEVDVDLNLVQNLMASYNAQEGLPGPAGNLAGLLGLHFPNKNEFQESHDMEHP